MTKAYADQLRHKAWIFQQETSTRKQIQWVLISVFGMEHNQHSLGLIERVITLDALFRTMSEA